MRTAWISLLSAALSGVVAEASAQDTPPAPVELKVMSFNVRYGTAEDGDNAWPLRRDLLVDTIRQYAPDLIGTQECMDFQAEYIGDQLDGYRWFGLGTDANDTDEMDAVFYRTRRHQPPANRPLLVERNARRTRITLLEFPVQAHGDLGQVLPPRKHTDLLLHQHPF